MGCNSCNCPRNLWDFMGWNYRFIQKVCKTVEKSMEETVMSLVCFDGRKSHIIRTPPFCFYDMYGRSCMFPLQVQ